MTKFQAGVHACLNCSQPTKGHHTYQGVVICSNCFALAQMCDKRAVEQVTNLLKVYRESLRVSLASGRLRPTTHIPKRDGEKVKPPTTLDLMQVIKDFAKITEVSDAKEDKEGVEKASGG